MMETVRLKRITAKHSASRRVSRGESDHTTDRWQDKGARGALAVGRFLQGFMWRIREVRPTSAARGKSDLQESSFT